MKLIKRANTTFEIAKTILKMQEEGYVPVSYKLPHITFDNSKDANRAELSPLLESMVEDNMNKIKNNKTIVVSTDINGVVNIYNKKKWEKGDGGIKLMIDSFSNIKAAKVCDNFELSGYNINSLLSFLKMLDMDFFYKDGNWRKAKAAAILKAKTFKEKML